MTVASALRNADANINGPPGGYEYLTYEPKKSPALIYSRRHTIYSKPQYDVWLNPEQARDQALYGMVNRYLQAVKWIQLLIWRNDSNDPQVKEVTVTTSLKVTKGSEINMGFNIGYTYEGMSLGYQFGGKIFSSVETSNTTTDTIRINVPPKSQIYFYQKQYEFRDNITFVLDLKHGELSNIGPWGGYTPLTSKATATTILANEWFTAIKPLKGGVGKMDVITVTREPLPKVTRKRDDATQEAKAFLAKLNI